MYRWDQSQACRHAPYDTGDYQDLIDRCYWNYLRVYVPEGATLMDFRTHAIPGEWMNLGEPVPARVDVLDNAGAVDQKPDGLSAFGAMVVVPRGEQRVTEFEFRLPSETITQVNPGVWLYHVDVQKQPGTLAVPLSVRVQLPEGAQLISADPEVERDGDFWRAELHLQTDIVINVRFKMP